MFRIMSGVGDIFNPRSTLDMDMDKLNIMSYNDKRTLGKATVLLTAANAK